MHGRKDQHCPGCSSCRAGILSVVWAMGSLGITHWVMHTPSSNSECRTSTRACNTGDLGSRGADRSRGSFGWTQTALAC